jgi:ADP-heptose:LPS heptosyltransferase
MVGGAKDEEKWNNFLPISTRIHSLASDSLDIQFAYFSQFDGLVCLDSSNLHLANMMQVPTVSIWGATHPSLGYGPFSLVENKIVQDSSLVCRPCTTYGKTNCYRGDFACLYQIRPEQVWEEVQTIVNKHAFPK